MTAVVGPRASFVGESASGHEFGGYYRDRLLPERSFMLPALERAVPRFGGEFEGSIGH
jgi:hypothetical protein